jgi:hypothetical protein
MCIFYFSCKSVAQRDMYVSRWEDWDFHLKSQESRKKIFIHSYLKTESTFQDVRRRSMGNLVKFIAQYLHAMS